MATYTGYGDGNSDSLFGIYLELEREGSAPNSNFFSDQDFMECVWHVRCIPHHKSIRQVWASVCVWTIWRDVKLLTMWFSDLSRSCHYDLQGAVAHSWVHCQWSYSWVGRILGLIIPTCLQRILLSGHGTWPTQEPPRRTVCNFTSLSFFDERYVRCCNLGLISTIFSKQFLTSTTLAMAMAMVASWYFFGPLHRPIPVRCTWNVFARKMHSTTEFAMTVLSKCVTHVGSIRCREPLGEYLSR